VRLAPPARGAYLLTNFIDPLAGEAMREIPASDAKARLSELLDKVERGETIVITRHGRAIARIVPDDAMRQKEVDAALEGIKTLRTRTGKMTRAELIAAKHEGHKY
jgi:prevent-host-death family protein